MAQAEKYTISSVNRSNQVSVLPVFQSFLVFILMFNVVLVSRKFEHLRISKMRDNLGFIMFVESFPLSSWSFIIYKSVHGIIVSYAPQAIVEVLRNLDDDAWLWISPISFFNCPGFHPPLSIKVTCSSSLVKIDNKYRFPRLLPVDCHISPFEIVKFSKFKAQTYVYQFVWRLIWFDLLY